MEARSEQQPLVLAFEDIHWADHGMLDLIEYLAQWVRGPLLLLCLARDELLEHRPAWGGGRRGATSIFLDPLSADETRELVTALLPGSAHAEKAADMVATRAGGNPFFAEEMARMLAEEGTIETAELPGTVQALLAARLDSLEPDERQLLQQASVVGRTFWEGSLAAVARDAGFDLHDALMSLQEKDLVVPSTGSQLAGEQEYAFKHVLIRDVAYGMLPKAVRSAKHFEVGRFIEDRMGDRTDEVVTVLAEHYGRAADARGGVGAARTSSSSRFTSKALHFLEAAGDAAALLYSNPEAFKHYKAARDIRCPHDPETLARIDEKQGDVALRMGRVDAAIEVWEECLEFHRSQEDLRRMGDLHRKIGAGLWHKGERKQALDHYQKGTNLLKDGPPCLELVRLYEEAAWLYMHAGDNMLAIYASEKALRLAERLGETRAASRAHGIFGRVFGRIGDSAKARENLERSVELARGSDEGETIRALLALGNHLEISDADYDAAGASYTEALDDLAARRRPARRRSSCMPRSPAGGVSRRLGGRRDLHRGQRRAGRARGPRRQAVPAVRARAGCSGGAAATGTPPRSPSGAPPSSPTRSAGPRSASRRCSASRRSCATVASSATRRPSSRRRSTSASARG